MKIEPGATTFDGVLRLGATPSSVSRDLQTQIAAAMPGQIPVVDRYFHVTLAGIGHLRPHKALLKGASFPTYKGPLEFEDTPKTAQSGSSLSTFVYATSQTQESLKKFTDEILEGLGIPSEEGRRYHLSLTNLSGFGPDNVGPVWLHEKPGPVLGEKQARAVRAAMERLFSTALDTPVESRYDTGWPVVGKARTAFNPPKFDKLPKLVVTNPASDSDIPGDAFNPSHVSNPEAYHKALFPIYRHDIAEYNPHLPSEKIDEKTNAAVHKAVHSHSEFLDILNKHVKPGSKILAPASGLGHEQMLAPQHKWTGLEFQKTLVDAANQRNKQAGLPTDNHEWSLWGGDFDAAMKELGPNWDEHLDKWDTIKDNPDVLYLKHACGGLTDGSLKVAADKGVQHIFIASCCSFRYIGISHKILAPEMSFDQWTNLVKRSSNTQSADGAKAVDEINDLRKKYLEGRGYKVTRGRTSHGPWLMASK